MNRFALGLLLFSLASIASAKWNGDVADRCFCKLSGEVDDCSCKVETLDSLNNNQIYPRLKSLLARNYFRYFKVNLKKQCPFWSDDSRCALKDCHVDICQKDEVPIKTEKQPDNESNNQHEKNKYTMESNKGEQGGGDCTEERQLSALDTTISDEKKAEFQSWREHDESLPMFCEVDDEHSNDLEYVDLLLNPERYTGYKGLSPRRIWRSIYEENCFKPEKSVGYGPEPITEADNYDSATSSSAMCLEKRVFYRLISGLHTSINIHLCDQYLFPAKNGFGPGTWGHNLKEFQRRFDPEKTDDHGPQRLKNLYFTYLVELRALSKAVPYLEEEVFYTGDAQEDADLKEGVKDFLAIVKNFPDHFDESQLFKVNSQEMLQLKSEFVHHFRNISRIMDCVGCDKCKLWGKLQVLGMGTALKVLFSGDSMAGDSTVNASLKSDFQLTRTEIVALFNAFGRLSSSIHALETFRALAR
ncbi:ERO1-like protein alpha isoform X2 [Aplysia californica]|uniref:ERO1-like protein alpha isoform X2 n=1 Tax=Aplysia californica TaxID=6500 RepID=A0ABM0JNN0_APLCA|nr:ERO1-like protein alpha isoform X2 [Aplysia californica]